MSRNKGRTSPFLGCFSSGGCFVAFFFYPNLSCTIGPFASDQEAIGPLHIDCPLDWINPIWRPVWVAHCERCQRPLQPLDLHQQVCDVLPRVGLLRLAFRAQIHAAHVRRDRDRLATVHAAGTRSGVSHSYSPQHAGHRARATMSPQLVIRTMGSTCPLLRLARAPDTAQRPLPPRSPTSTTTQAPRSTSDPMVSDCIGLRLHRHCPAAPGRAWSHRPPSRTPRGATRRGPSGASAPRHGWRGWGRSRPVPPVARQPSCPVPTTTLAGFEAAGVGVLFGVLSQLSPSFWLSLMVVAGISS